MKPRAQPVPGRDVALVELVNRVLDRGVVVSGEMVISVAQIDLLYLNLNLLLSSVESLLTGDPHGRGSDRVARAGR